MTGKAPADWKDVAFFRSTGQTPGWLAALTKRHKLVLGVQDPPWLMDLERDPDELTNFAEHKDYRETTRMLAKELIAYAKRYGDPFAGHRKIKYDLEWCAEGAGAYQMPAWAKTPRKRA